MGASARPYGGYHRVSDAREDPELTHTGPRTPCGEYFRRFWIPVAMTEELGEHPTPVTVLGEDLVLFRDLSGRLGLLHKHCSHRRASLEYGIVSERGVRCCYHGWLFDVDGTILEMPGEPAESPIARRLCHGAYPVTELAGLVFAYLGPPELRPEFTRLDTLSLPGDELVPYAIDYPCNWLQVAENPMDPFHSVFLHTRVTRAHFNPAWGALPVVEWYPREDGTGIHLTNRAPLGGLHLGAHRRGHAPGHRAAAGHLPEPGPGEVLPRRRHHQVDGAGRRYPVPDHRLPALRPGARPRRQGRSLPGRTEPGGLRRPDRHRAIPGRRAGARRGTTRRRSPRVSITVHAGERLATTDKGVALYRRMLRKAIRNLAAGDEPPQLRTGPNDLVPTMAGDVIVRVPASNEDDIALQRTVGRAVGRIVFETMDLERPARRVEIERRVLAWIGSRDQSGGA